MAEQQTRPPQGLQRWVQVRLLLRELEVPRTYRAEAAVMPVKGGDWSRRFGKRAAEGNDSRASHLP